MMVSVSLVMMLLSIPSILGRCFHGMGNSVVPIVAEDGEGSLQLSVNAVQRDYRTGAIFSVGLIVVGVGCWIIHNLIFTFCQ